ncbi:hypothetical protein HanPSC8_Chr04g0180001 [Helianthus annuus]|nr:hypothetical protein HanPSC8_Chr04g0180001 [Helianthus annuus]
MVMLRTLVLQGDFGVPSPTPARSHIVEFLCKPRTRCSNLIHPPNSLAGFQVGKLATTVD